VEALCDQLLAGPALAYHQHWAAHRRGPAGTLYGVKEGPGLANELIAPFHARSLAQTPNNWQHLPYG
jgi:hypothetical protein